MIKYFLRKIAARDFARRAIEERADLSPFKKKPDLRIILGLCALGGSYIICWPLISGLTTLSILWSEPWIIIVGGPLSYGISHLSFMTGMYLVGEKYTRVVFRWLTRIALEKFLDESDYDIK
jgi:hypothetical protein